MALGSGGDEEMAFKRANGVLERLGVVAVGGGSKILAVQLAAGVGARCAPRRQLRQVGAGNP
jgi:hypothetical protein